MRTIYHIVIRIIAIAALLAAVALLYIPAPEGIDRGNRDFRDSLRCSILLDRGLASKNGRCVGFAYELLQYYADETGTPVNFYPPATSSWDSLLSGSYDMLVVSADQSIPEYYSSQVYITEPVRNGVCMAISREKLPLFKSCTFWLSGFKDSMVYKRICSRFFRSYKFDDVLAFESPVERLSPYDGVIRHYSKAVDIDWRLVSALVFQESQYYMGAESGNEGNKAVGLMQIKETTASRYGVDDLFDPEMNVKAGTRHFKYLADLYRKEGMDSLNVVKFALGAYNCGDAKIAKCRDHAREHGLDDKEWEQVTSTRENYETYVGKQTIEYVSSIMARYDRYKMLID